MGTRSITTIIDEQFNNSDKILTMYRQYDGYPSGHGMELYKFLAPFMIVNGLNSTQQGRIANGAGCLAAQMLHFFKQADGEVKHKAAPGGIYVVKPRVKLDGEDYGYEITIKPDLKLSIAVKTWGNKKLFEGSLPEFSVFCSKKED